MVQYGSISEIAQAETIERGYLGKMLHLTLLAPVVVEAVINGGAAQELSLPMLRGEVRPMWAV